MGADEEGTLERLKALRRELVDPKIAKHRGRIPGPDPGTRPPATACWWNFRASSARRLAGELGLADRASFVHADLYDAPAAIPEGATFDMVYVTWGAIVWLPDIYRWAQIVCDFLKPGGSLYLAEAHPAAMVFDDAAVLPDGRPGYFAPYFSREPVVMEEAHDYIDETTTVANATTYTWVHPLGDVISALLRAGMTLDWLHEHDAVTWHMFDVLVRGADRLWRWPDRPWLPLAFSLRVTRR
jgi:SAM-dependent methyltransferase